MAVLDALDIDKAVLVGNSMGCPVGLEVAHQAPERVHGLVLVSPAGGVHNQPLRPRARPAGQDGFRESPRMIPVAVPDYVRFGPLNGLRLFRELTLYPSLERLVHTPVPTLAVLGGRDPLMPSPARVREVARLRSRAPDRRAHREGRARPELQPPRGAGGAIAAWLEDALVDGARLPRGVRLVDSG